MSYYIASPELDVQAETGGGHDLESALAYYLKDNHEGLEPGETYEFLVYTETPIHAQVFIVEAEIKFSVSARPGRL